MGCSIKETTFKKNDAIKVIAEIASFIETLDDNKEYTLQINAVKQKRSLNSNSLAWALIDKLAEKTGIAKTEIYKSYIKEIGGNSDTLCVIDKAVERFREEWQKKGVGWVTDVMPSKIQGCTNVIVYYGSSTYDSKQMSRLINLIIQDCRENGIKTPEDEEIERLEREWG